MNIKSIAALGLVAVAMSVTTLLPAEANNNNDKALNLMAMQMYMQNQANAANYNRFNPISPIQNAAYGPTYSGNIYANGFGNNGFGNNNFGGCNNGFMGGNPYNNMVSSPQYQRLANEAAQIQMQLSYGNLPAWKYNSLQNKLNKIRRQQTNLSAYGYGNPYGGSGILNNLRYNLGI